jgi:hypothetical protein
MTNEAASSLESAAVAEQGANVAPEKASSKKGAPKGAEERQKSGTSQERGEERCQAQGKGRQQKGLQARRRA